MRTVSRTLSRRGILGLGAGAAAAATLAGCGSHTSSDGAGRSNGSGDGKNGQDGGASGAPQGRLIGDGSTSYTGKQPHQPAAPEPLQPGQTPP
ncbi:hypothetical protein ACFV2N_32660, partial [Streptomyces sp. NPDC059680]